MTYKGKNDAKITLNHFFKQVPFIGCNMPNLFIMVR